MRQSNKYHT